MRTYPSYHLAGASPLPLDVGYLLTAAPAPTILRGFFWPWMWGIFTLLVQLSAAAVPDLGCGVSIHGCFSKVQAPLLTSAMGLSPLGGSPLQRHVVMLKILQARPQQYMNREHPDVQTGFRKGRGTRDQIANIDWIMEKAREFQKNIYFCFIDYAKAFDCVDHNKLWKILQEMGIPDHLTCLLRNLYAGQ